MQHLDTADSTASSHVLASRLAEVKGAAHPPQSLREAMRAAMAHSSDFLGAVGALVHRTEHKFGVSNYRNREGTYVRLDSRGFPYIRQWVDTAMVFHTDCAQSETAIRAQMDFKGRKGPKAPPWVEFDGIVNPVEPYSDLSLGAVLASAVGKRAHLHPDTRLPIVFLGNVAPRSHLNAKSVGTPFVLAELPGDVFYLGTLGKSLSLVKEHIVGQRVFELDIEHANADTVYRSQYLPHTAYRWLWGSRGVLRQATPLSAFDAGVIPAISPETVITIDDQRNIKTNMTANHPFILSLELGQLFKVRIGEHTQTARFSSTLADGESGTLVLSMGSTCHDPKLFNNRLFDFYVINGHAADLFPDSTGKALKVGATFHLEHMDGTRVTSHSATRPVAAA